MRLHIRQPCDSRTTPGDVIYTVVIKPGSWDPRLRWNMTATVTIGV